MEFELPSLPKSVVLNVALIVAIFLGAIIAIVGFWQFVPLLLDQEEEGPQQSELVVNFTYLRAVTRGEDWIINGTALNPSNETITDIKIRIFSDGNIQGYEHTIGVLVGGQTIDFVIQPKIKLSAILGEFTAQTVVSVPGTLPAEYELQITIG